MNEITNLVKCVWSKESYKGRHWIFNDNFLRNLFNNWTSKAPHLTWSRTIQTNVNIIITWKKSNIPIHSYITAQQLHLTRRQTCANSLSCDWWNNCSPNSTSSTTSSKDTSLFALTKLHYKPIQYKTLITPFHHYSSFPQLTHKHQ